MFSQTRMVEGLIGTTALKILDVRYKNYRVGEFLIAPTANCQLNTWRKFNSLLDQYIPFNEFRDFYLEFNENRPLLLVDIQSKYLSLAIKFFGEDRIIVNSPYKSSNGNDMVILIANII